MAHVSDLIETDIDAYLEAHQHKSLLRFITCGSHFLPVCAAVYFAQPGRA